MIKSGSRVRDDSAFFIPLGLATFYLKFNISSTLTFHEYFLTLVFPCFTRYFLLKSHYKSEDRVFESPLPCHGLHTVHHRAEATKVHDADQHAIRLAIVSIVNQRGWIRNLMKGI
jgi:hypothetical protein